MGMDDVTRFSGMFTRMAFDYARSSKRPRVAKPTERKPKTELAEATSADEGAVRAAMEGALERHRQSKRIA